MSLPLRPRHSSRPPCAAERYPRGQHVTAVWRYLLTLNVGESLRLSPLRFPIVGFRRSSARTRRQQKRAVLALGSLSAPRTLWQRLCVREVLLGSGLGLAWAPGGTNEGVDVALVQVPAKLKTTRTPPSLRARDFAVPLP